MDGFYERALESIKRNKNGILDLSLTGLTQIPEEILALKNLFTLNLAYNQIQDISILQYLKNLKFLNLSHNQIQDISSLKNLKNLSRLFLSYNHIRDIYSLKNIKNLNYLDLGNNQIQDISFLKHLKNLNYLLLGGNFIPDISIIKNLKNLSYLDLSHNLIRDFSCIQHIEELRELNLRQNRIQDISFIENLRNLNNLDLSNNLIQNISCIQHIEELRKLHLRQNQIQDISFIKNLKNLSYLDLSHNLIRDFSSLKLIIESGLPVKFDYRGDGIYLIGNPIETPPLEIIKQGNEAILNYFKEIEKGSTELYEAKLLIIGEGGSGKTSLTRKLIDKDATMPHEYESTKGIDIHHYHFTTKEGKEFRINIWDFAGQAISHATHQFFLTKRSLYILLDDTRKDDKTVNDATFSYWLQVVELLSEKSPVLIVQNEKADRSKELDLKSMRSRFDNIKECYPTNIQSYRGIPEVKNAIEHFIQELPHVGEKLPTHWLTIRDILEKLSEEKDFISLDDYIDICKKNKIETDEKALQLSSYLHDLGVFLHFQDGSILEDIFILKNKWATDAVYKVLDNENVKSKSGRFSKNNLKEIWNEPRYKRKENILVALMEKFDLCYPMEDVKDCWLAPQLLAVQAPDNKWNAKNNLILRFQYGFMPKGLLSRFFVRMNRYVKDLSKAWVSGVVLERDNTQALIVETYGSQEIVIKVEGNHPKELMTIIAEEFDKLHEGYGKNLKVTKLIPCICDTCKQSDEPNTYEFEDLKRRKEKNKPTVECKVSYDAVNVIALLEGIFTKIKKDEMEKLKVFMSYSHKDEDLKNKLDDHLAMLKRGGKIEVWHDRKILASEEWDDVIIKQIESADIILLLVSSGFNASNYIWKVEIKKAMERHEKKEARVIPVFMKHCDYREMPYSKLQGLPRDAKFVDSQDNKDLALTEVAKGIRAVVDSWGK